jgi:hypothetical protein
MISIQRPQKSLLRTPPKEFDPTPLEELDLDSEDVPEGPKRVLLGFDPGGGNPKAGEMATLPVDFVPESDSVASLFPTMDAPEAPKRLLVEGVGDATGFCPVSPGVIAVVDALVGTEPSSHDNY